MSAKRKQKEAVELSYKLDLGCGIPERVKPGFDGVDSRPFGQKYVVDLVKLLPGVDGWRVLGAPTSDGYDLFEKWPWPDNSVEEVNCSHFYEHLNQKQRAFFLNELWRVMKPEGKVTMITPHWASIRAYGDLAHEWPPVTEFHWYYLSKEWRKPNCPHDDFLKCDFACTWGYNLHPNVAVRDQSYQAFAMENYKEAIQDMHCSMVAKK